MITLHRCRRNKHGYPGAYFDVTVKSAKGLMKKLAPTWAMVMEHKNGTITNEEYAERYIRGILDEVERWDVIHQALDVADDVTFECYCPDGAFCHTYLLAYYLERVFPDRYVAGTEMGDKYRQMVYDLIGKV